MNPSVPRHQGVDQDRVPLAEDKRRRGWREQPLCRGRSRSLVATGMPGVTNTSQLRRSSPAVPSPLITPILLGGASASGGNGAQRIGTSPRVPSPIRLSRPLCALRAVTCGASCNSETRVGEESKAEARSHLDQLTAKTGPGKIRLRMRLRLYSPRVVLIRPRSREGALTPP